MLCEQSKTAEETIPTSSLHETSRSHHLESFVLQPNGTARRCGREHQGSPWLLMRKLGRSPASDAKVRTEACTQPIILQYNVYRSKVLWKHTTVMSNHMPFKAKHHRRVQVGKLSMGSRLRYEPQLTSHSSRATAHEPHLMNHK